MVCASLGLRAEPCSSRVRYELGRHRLGEGLPPGQNPGRDAVLLVSQSLTLSGRCNLCLSGRILLLLGMGGQQQQGQRRAGMLLAWGRVVRRQNPGRLTVQLAGGSLTHSGLCCLGLLGGSQLGLKLQASLNSLKLAVKITYQNVNLLEKYSSECYFCMENKHDDMIISILR